MEIKQEIQDIVANFSFKGPILVDSILMNVDNDLYFVTDSSGKKFTVRVAKRLKEKDPEFETNLLRVLADNRVDISHLMPLKDGTLYARTNDDWLVFVFEFIEGKQYKAKDITFQPNLAYLGGKVLGKMHSIAAAHKKEIGENKKRNAFTEINALLAADTTKISSIKGFTKIRGELEEFKKKATAWIRSNPDLCGAIHNDYGPQNAIFKGDICSIIDFDWACSGPFWKDVGQGIALWTELLPPGTAKWDNDAAKEFIQGYNDSAPKSVVFGPELAFWVCFACLSDACTFFLAFLDGRYPNITLINVEQCHGYKRYLYFKKYL